MQKKLYLCALNWNHRSMKRILSVLVFICFALCAGAETVFEFTSEASMQQTKDGFTVTLAQGANAQNAPVFKPKTEYYEAEMRLYLDNTITLTGGTMTNVQLVCAKSASGKPYAELKASVGELTSGGESTDAKDFKADTWTGNATSVVFTLSNKGQRQLQKIIINGAEVVIEPEEPEPLPTAEDLDKRHRYAEPTQIQVPDTQIFKNEYAFIENNILVHCTKGSILRENTKEGEEYPAYFNCNENEQISFTATRSIHKLEIDGFLRKAFTATCDKGTMTHKANEDFDVELDNVLVISDIYANKVTINCDKQLRCFEVRAYFKEETQEEEESLERIQHSDVRSQKVLHDGQLIIVRGEKTYTAQGKEL